MRSNQATSVVVSGVIIAINQEAVRKNLPSALHPLLGEIDIEFLMRRVKPEKEVVICAMKDAGTQEAIGKVILTTIGNYGPFKVVFQDKSDARHKNPKPEQPDVSLGG